MTTKVTSSDHCSSPDELRKLAEDIRLAFMGEYMIELARTMDTAADAWEAQLKTSPWQIGVELIEAKSRIDALEKALRQADICFSFVGEDARVYCSYQYGAWLEMFAALAKEKPSA